MQCDTLDIRQNIKSRLGRKNLSGIDNKLSNFPQDNLMRKLACKTLMEILPPDVGTKISEEIKEKKLSVDFDTVVGLVVG